MLLKNLLITTLILVVSYAPATLAQSSNNSLDFSQTEILSINDSNLYCFQNLQCLKAENPFKNTDLSDIHLNGTKEKYVIEGKSKNEELYAEYDGKNGNVITSVVIQRNVQLPRNILVELNTGEYKGWQMAGNTRVIKNFAKETTRYEVAMMKDGELRIEHFNANGMLIDPII